MGIGLATGAPDTHPAPTVKGTPTREFSTPGRLPDRGFCFFKPRKIAKCNLTIIKDHHMNNRRYYRNDIDFAWRFSNLRSGQPAASERSMKGGSRTFTANPANCRTPQ